MREIFQFVYSVSIYSGAQLKRGGERERERLDIMKNYGKLKSRMKFHKQIFHLNSTPIRALLIKRPVSDVIAIY